MELDDTHDHAGSNRDAVFDAERLDADPPTTTELVKSVYQRVFHEFYEWEQEIECPQLIASLVCGNPSYPDSEDDLMEMDIDNATTESMDDLDLSCSMTYLDLENNSQIVLPSHELLARTAIEPHPRYEACAPALRNIAPRALDTWEETDAQFIPYADDPRFNISAFLRNFHFRTWEDIGSHDPDLEIIQLEAARRLHFRLGLTFAEIDNTRILPLLRDSNESGLLWTSSQRDLLRWPGALLSELDELKRISFLPDPEDIATRLSGLVSSFCPNLNCIVPYCSVHGYSHTMPEPARAKFSSSQLRVDKLMSCGPFCFIHASESDKDQVSWEDPTEISTLKTILSVMPDLLPCQLAVVCRKPCKEVFVQRSRLFPDEEIGRQPDPGGTRNIPLIFVDGPSSSSSDFTPVPPCNHKGACDDNADCACWTKHLHCHRNCRCSTDCKRRWKGCKCVTDKIDKKRPCSQNNCPCRQAGRECDPELCKSCGAKGGNKKRHCDNVSIQKGIFQHLEIKRGDYGLGAFLTKGVAKDDIIGEYVAELFGLHDTAREIPQRHRGLNYSFDLNQSYLLDAARVGNETRYINHAKGPKTNCIGSIHLVNGEHRIALTATKKIKAGVELLFDYGDNYWNGH